ncbi:MAG: V-type ATP synthase subunit D [Candidatus Heimdallarchaeota archaeon]|nr:V-type ATP synthase subunit D [Candidatus Heimdallarchaeota archaeon]
MSSDKIEGIAPTRMQLLELKKRVSLATHGHDLLKEKMDALIIEFYNVIDEVKESQSESEGVLIKAHAQLGLASLKLGMAKLREIGLAAPETLSLLASTRSIMGVKIPQLSLSRKQLAIPFYNAEGTSIALDDSVFAFREYLFSVVNLAEKIATLQKLAYEISSTKRRVNALNHIIIPRLQNTTRFIDLALEEEDREQFSRMKFIKNKLNEETDLFELDTEAVAQMTGEIQETVDIKQPTTSKEKVKKNVIKKATKASRPKK